jgi:hypothetical protein
MCDNFQMRSVEPLQAMQRPVYASPHPPCPSYWTPAAQQIMTSMGVVNLHSYAQTALAPANSYYTERSPFKMTVDGNRYVPKS